MLHLPANFYSSTRNTISVLLCTKVRLAFLKASNNTGILNTRTQLWLMESEQAIPMDSIKDVVRSSVKVPEFDKHLKKAEDISAETLWK